MRCPSSQWRSLVAERGLGYVAVQVARAHAVIDADDAELESRPRLRESFLRHDETPAWLNKAAWRKTLRKARKETVAGGI
jgi:hypothetical protein